MKSDPVEKIDSSQRGGIQNKKVTFSEVAKLPTSHAHFSVRVVKDSCGTEHVIIYKGSIENADVLDVECIQNA